MAAPVIIVHGPTRAGKSSQAKRLAANLGYHYLSSGDAVRATSDPVVVDLMARGELVRSEDILRLMKAAIGAVPSDEPILIDGFPRMPGEFEVFLGWLTEADRPLRKVIELYITPDESHKRGEHRGRVDDEYEMVEKKWRWYHEETGQVLDRAKEMGLYARVDGIGDLDAVEQRMTAAIGQ